MSEQLRSEVDLLRTRAAAATESEARKLSSSSPSTSSSSSDEQGAKAGAAEAECESLRAQLSRLSDELRGIKSASGLDYVPGRTKVLHLKDNPVLQAATAKGSGAVAAYHNRREESSLPQEALRAALVKAREAQAATAAAATVAENTKEGIDSAATGVSAAAAAPAPVAAAPPAVDSTKLNVRLKEMFKERITTFREAVYLLTGWKIDMIFETSGTDGSSPKPQLRLRSMYAESPEDSLLWQWTQENKLNLMETPFASRMDPKLLQSLQTLNSVPIFLGGVASELFEMQTMM